MTLTREQLARTERRRFARVTIADGEIHPDAAQDLDAHVRIQSLEISEMDAYEAVPYDASGTWQAQRIPFRRRKLLQLCLVDDNGSRLFEGVKLADIKMDGGLSASLFAACIEHTGIERSLQARESVEDAKKNSSSAPDSSSHSDSASSST